MPDPIEAFAIFSIILAFAISLWRENYEYAVWHFSILLFMGYLQYWKWLKSKGKE